jgi:hypothetical protein
MAGIHVPGVPQHPSICPEFLGSPYLLPDFVGAEVPMVKSVILKGLQPGPDADRRGMRSLAHAIE